MDELMAYFDNIRSVVTRDKVKDDVADQQKCGEQDGPDFKVLLSKHAIDGIQKGKC